MHGKTCDITFSGTLIDGLACHMEGSALVFSLMDSDATATLRTDGDTDGVAEGIEKLFYGDET